MPTWSGFGVQSSVSVTFCVERANASGTSTASAATRTIASLRMRHLWVPGDEDPLGERHERVERERERAQNHDGSEDTRGIECRLGLQDHEAEPGRGAGPLAEDRPDGRVGRRD